MNSSKNPNSPYRFLRVMDQTLRPQQGNIMVYLVVVLLIFGILGVTIASLFYSATTSSATPNDARRAYYVAESGVRYALSRIRNANFHQDFIEDINNTPQYTLEDGSYFTINIFSPWFISPSAQDTSANNIFTLSVPNAGKIPQNLSIPNTNVLLVNWQTFVGSAPSNSPPSDSYAQITGTTITAGNSSLTITMGGSDDLVVNINETVCLAVQPTDSNANLQAGEDIYIAPEAKDFFPPRNGAIRIITADNQAGEYFYEKLVDETTRMRLTNLAALPGSPLFAEISSFGTDDWVVLSRYNYRVITTGTSGDVTTEIGQGNQKQIWFFPRMGDWTITQRDFIEDAVSNVTDDGVIKTQLGVSEDDDEIQFGEDTDTDAGFGSIWYGGDKSIGGDNNFCQNGRCFFNNGIRIFFTVGYSGDGEGFVFALLNGADNTTSSAGGDGERSELLGYAGDSREIPTGAPFLDGTLNGDGLLPPKMGLEFDTRTNFDGEFEQTLNYCSDATTLRPNTRNDPLPGGNPEDAIQHVFWGNTILDILCRQDDATYDDNKHDAEDIFEKWSFDTGNNVQSSPAIGVDGTVYFGSDSQRVYALNPADRLAGEAFPTTNEWEFDTNGNVKSSPAIGADGTIYIGSDSNKVYAFNPTERLAGSPFPSTNEWEFATGANVQSSPALGADGTIYVGDDAGTFYALSPAGVKRWEFTDPGLRRTSRGRPAIGPALDIDPTGNRQRIYITSREGGDQTLYALDPEDRQRDYDFNDRPFPNAPNEWIFDLGDEAEFMPGVDDRPLPLGTGTVYSDESGNEIRAVGPDSSLGNGNSQWVRSVGTDFDSTPKVGADGTIYFGVDSGHLFALNPDGSIKWQFPASGSIGPVKTSPTIGPNESIYFGSDDDNLYAVNPDVTNESDREKFSFDTGGSVRSSPAVDPGDETVYVGSDSNRLHAFNQLAEPRNFRKNPVEDDPVIDKKLVSSADFPEITFADTNDSNNWLQHGDGLWAVRMEVTYDGPVDGEEQYTLKTWVEKCAESGCSKFLTAFYRDTLVNYDVTGIPPKLEQTIKLSAADHGKLTQFLFGFTTAAAFNDTQEAIIRFFELSFIRSTDPVVTSDPNIES